MDKYFEIRNNGFDMKITIYKSKFMIRATRGRITMEISGDNLEDAINKCHAFCLSFLESPISSRFCN